MFVHSFQRLKHRWFQWNRAALAWNPPKLLWFLTQRLLSSSLSIQFLQRRLLWTNASFTQNMVANQQMLSLPTFTFDKDNVQKRVGYIQYEIKSYIKSEDQTIYYFLWKIAGKWHFVVELVVKFSSSKCNPVWSGWVGENIPKTLSLQILPKTITSSLKGARSRHYQFKLGDPVICQYSPIFSILIFFILTCLRQQESTGKLCPSWSKYAGNTILKFQTS